MLITNQGPIILRGAVIWSHGKVYGDMHDVFVTGKSLLASNYCARPIKLGLKYSAH